VPGLLIVNADDLGFNRRATESILDCFAGGSISSATAMVWMSDSDRAAAVAMERGLPIGLHLNLTQPLNGTLTPEPVRARQHEVTTYLSRDTWSTTKLRGAQAQLVTDVVGEQLERFRELYGEPTHVDGHHHVHLHPVVQAAIPDTLPVRPPLRHPRKAAGRMNREERALHKRFLAPRFAFAFEHVHPALGGYGLDALGRAHSEVLEVMVHPPDGQQDALAADPWRRALERFRLGSYRTFSALTASGG
jgi:chitin disaccharide deacetylase